MTLCQKCIHSEVCAIRDCHDEGDELALTFCNQHKPKSRLVELPCEGGQTVYFLDVCRTAEDFGKRFVNFGIVAKVSCDYEFVIVKGGSVLDWGDVFLSREEAENALRERSK